MSWIDKIRFWRPLEDVREILESDIVRLCHCTDLFGKPQQQFANLRLIVARQDSGFLYAEILSNGPERRLRDKYCRNSTVAQALKRRVDIVAIDCKRLVRCPRIRSATRAR